MFVETLIVFLAGRINVAVNLPTKVAKNGEFSDEGRGNSPFLITYDEKYFISWGELRDRL